MYTLVSHQDFSVNRDRKVSTQSCLSVKSSRSVNRDDSSQHRVSLTSSSSGSDKKDNKKMASSHSAYDTDISAEDFEVYQFGKSLLYTNIGN
jgi:hypothetical protein